MRFFGRMNTWFGTCFGAMFFALGTSNATALSLPDGAILSAERIEVATSQPFPTEAFKGEQTTMYVAIGSIAHKAYQLAATTKTSLQLIAPLRQQLQSEGFKITYACAAVECGGFDFRFLLDILREPAMHVDLGDFHYVLAQHPDGRSVAIVTSRTRNTGYIHISSVTPNGLEPVVIEASETALVDTTVTREMPPPAGRLAGTLRAKSSVPLDDLDFETGSSALADKTFGSLEELAQLLAQTPDMTLTLVGHTDSVGSLEANIELSRKRAKAVHDRLIQQYGVSQDQLSAEGIGYLSPRASNTTAEGREKNRRVEAVLTSTPQ